MKTKTLIALLIVFGLASAVIYAHVSTVSVPAVEVNALFESADSDKDGVISKEEFEKHLVRMRTKPVSQQESVRICPTTGAPCSGEGMCSSGNGEACGGGSGSCCSTKTVAQVLPKIATETQSQSGCCGGKNKAEKKEGGCCGGKNKAEMKEGGCCGGKNKAEMKEGGCCGGKNKVEQTEKKEENSVTTEP